MFTLARRRALNSIPVRRNNPNHQIRLKSETSESIQSTSHSRPGNTTTTTTTTTPDASNAVEKSASLSTTTQILSVLGYPGRMYSSSQQRRPYLTQFLTGIVIYFAGDLSTQYVRRPRAGPDEEQPPFSSLYDPIRGFRNIIIGGLWAIPSYRWFLFLGTLFNYQSIWLSLLAKTVFAQIVFPPVSNTVFFGMQSLLAGMLPSKTAGDPPPASLLVDPGLALSDAGTRISETVPMSWYNSWFFWPPVTMVLFRFVKPQSRSALAGVVAVVWQTYLGILNQRAVEKEARETVELEKQVAPHPS